MTVSLPETESVDRPRPESLSAFVDRLEAALEVTLARGSAPSLDLAPFTWRAVFARVEALWRELADGASRGGAQTL